jgi:hypothetical protein
MLPSAEHASDDDRDARLGDVDPLVEDASRRDRA